MAEQAQRDAEDLDGLQDVALDAASPPPQNPLANLLNAPDAPVTPPPTEQPAPQLQPKRAQLLQNLLNAIPIASADQIAQMLQVFAPENAQPAPAGQGAPAPAPRPQSPTYPLPPRVYGDAVAATFDPLGHLLPQVTRKRWGFK